MRSTSRSSSAVVAVALTAVLVALLALTAVPGAAQPDAVAQRSGKALGYSGPSSGASLVGLLRANRTSSAALTSGTGRIVGKDGRLLIPPTADDGVAPVRSPALENVVWSVIGSAPGTWAVLIKHLDTGERVAINADTQMNVASLYKLQVLYAAYVDERAGRLSLNEMLPEGWTVRQALRAMITVSDNDAAYALLRRIGTDRVNAMMYDLGLTQSYIDEWGWSTARETAILLEMIALGEAVDPAASRAMRSLLFDQQINDRIPLYLPPGIVAHKTGELPGIRNDAGIVYGPSGPYLMVVVTSDLPDEDYGASIIADLSLAVYQYFN